MVVATVLRSAVGQVPSGSGIVANGETAVVGAVASDVGEECL